MLWSVYGDGSAEYNNSAVCLGPCFFYYFHLFTVTPNWRFEMGLSPDTLVATLLKQFGSSNRNKTGFYYSMQLSQLTSSSSVLSEPLLSAPLSQFSKAIMSS